MRRHILTPAGAVLLAGVLLAGCGNEDPAEPENPAAPQAETETDPDAQPAAQNVKVTPELAETFAAMRAATSAYATDLSAARDAGYQMITEPGGAGVHLLNPSAPEEFDPNAPAMLIYTGSEDQAQLAALGWVFKQRPADLPLEGAKFGALRAACYYEDGKSVPNADEAACEPAHPETGSPFTFWHSDLTTLHVWAWSANPDGLFAPTNPLMNAAAAPGTDPDEQGPDQQAPDQQAPDQQAPDQQDGADEQGEN